MPPGRKKLWRKFSAAHARAAKSAKLLKSAPQYQSDSEAPIPISSDSEEDEQTRWIGGVNHDLTETESDLTWFEPSSEGDDESEEEFSEVEGDAVAASLRASLEHEIELLSIPTPYEEISAGNITNAMWKKAESNRSLGYNGRSDRTKRRETKKARDKETVDKDLRANGAAMMRSFLAPKRQPSGSRSTSAASTPAGSRSASQSRRSQSVQPADNAPIFTGYPSDLSSVTVPESGDEADTEGDVPDQELFPVTQPPALKRRRLEIPSHVARAEAKMKKEVELKAAKVAIEKLLASTDPRTFDAGHNGLQAYRAQAIQSYFWMVVDNGKDPVDASEQAAESQGFARKWGGRLVRRWVRAWIDKRELPVSARGNHVKSHSLLEDPAIRAELRSYLRSNKWAMDPAKLAEYSKVKMIPAAAEQYLKHAIDEEMPRGLKKYIELELFPRIHMKVGKGISLETARLANDGKKRSWVLNSEHAIKKKGVGRGMHTSQVICSTKGLLVDAGQSIEYGKNYDGYWTGELFVKQLAEKIIPAFEKAHGPGFQALIMVDNSQGHAAYATDALLVSRMNLRPGGKQARMRDGWFMGANGEKIMQPMIFSPNHPDFPNEPKGIKQKYLRNNCDYTFATLQANLPKALASVELSTIRKWEHRMIRWMEAYRSGLDAKDAQFEVQKFSSRRYKSHRRVPETLARQFDQ
ncbi:hypothetical protein BJ912DRAFT_913240 [Pholiota molesta]|nr:hypothetical protein BJ912DRAFT_913240 [Pholiota molesta]